MLLFSLERQPKEGRWLVVYPDSDTTDICIASRSPWPLLVLMGLGGGSILVALCFIVFLGSTWDRLIWKMMGLGLLAILFGLWFFFGRARVALSPDALSRSFYFAGIHGMKGIVRWNDISRIACAVDHNHPVIRVYRGKEILLHLEDFASAAERDWVADGIRAAWSRAVKSSQ